MTGRGIQVGTLWERPVLLDFSFFLVIGIFVLFGGLQMLPLLWMLFGLVFLHEMGHIAVALHLGYGYHGVILHGLGGAAIIKPKRYFNVKEEILVASAGPAVNLALCLPSFLAMQVYPHILIAYLFHFNLLIGAFNLLPFYPMDGGRIVHAVVAHFSSLEAADGVALWLGRAGGVAFIAFGLAQGWPMLAVVGIFLLWYGGKECRSAIQEKR